MGILRHSVRILKIEPTDATDVGTEGIRRWNVAKCQDVCSAKKKAGRIIIEWEIETATLRMGT